VLSFLRKGLVVLVIFGVLLLPSLDMAAEGKSKLGEGKFRDVPLEMITVMEKQFSSVLTPNGPNEEVPRGAKDLTLTPEEEVKVKELGLDDYYFMGASLDMTEILNKYGMDQELAHYGFQPIKFMGSSSIAEQIDQVNSLAGKAGAISFVIAEAWEPVTLGPAFVNLAKAGVPQVHNWTTPQGLAGTENYVGLVDADGYAQGMAAAEILSYAMGYQGEVGIIYFSLEQWTNVMRLKGAKDAFAKYPGIKIVSEVGFTDPSQSYDLAVGMLQKNPEIDAIWATWMMGPATGGAEAVIALNKVGEVIVAAPDLGGTTGAKYIADPNHPIIGAGEADCVEMGVNSIRSILKYLAGNREISQGYFVSRVYPIVKANLVEAYNKTNLEAIGPLPQEVLDLLK